VQMFSKLTAIKAALRRGMVVDDPAARTAPVTGTRP
jgi:hypothetical protein